MIERMEKNGIKIDTAYLSVLGRQVTEEINVLEKKIFKSVGMVFNINSPQQLSAVLFNKLRVADRGLKKTPGRVISTAAPELTKLKGKHAAIDLVLAYRELNKLKTTYIDALPKLVGADGRLHTTFDQLGTTTGRLSSKNPNLQNIPTRTDLGRSIRRAFVADEGYQLISADYSQIELRVVASLAQDKQMIEAFRKDQDIHILTAAEIFEMAPTEVNHEMRQAAKVLNFGVLYGMSIHGFAQAAGIDFAKAKKFVNKYFAEFAGVAAYVERTKKEAADQGCVQTLFGRKRFIPEINSSVFSLRQAAERMAINMPVQGTAADLIKMAMVKIASAIENKKTRLLLQVHDELIFEAPGSEIAEVSAAIRETMEKVHQLAVPLKVEIKTGPNWGELKKIGS